MDWVQYYDVSVPMRDGVELVCDVRLPAGRGPFPIVLLRTPYNKNVHPESTRMENISQYLDHGYGMVIMDVRGKYESDGEFPIMAFRREGDDGADTVAWIAAQPWCNGKVAMTGASYCGYVQVYAAREHPAALCAITPGVFGNDGFGNIVRRNGIPQMSLLIWALHHATGRVAKIFLLDWAKILFALPLRQLVEATGMRRTAVFDRWMRHNHDNRFWHSMGKVEALADLRVPVLLTGGWFDLYSSAVVDSFVFLQQQPHLKGKIALMMGPWLHGMGARESGELDFGPTAEVDITEVNRRWIDGWCREVEADPIPPVRYFVMGVNEWRRAEQWPPVATEEEFLLLACDCAANGLTGDGRLDDCHGTAATDRYIYDPAAPVINLGGNVLSFGEGMTAGPCDQRKMEERPDMLVYTGEVLDRPLEIIGFPRVELYVASDAVDTDFVARLCDVYPDGRSINLSTGIVRMRYRNGFDREDPMAPGEIYRVEIRLDVTAAAFLPGHRLRLEIAGSSFPQFARNHNTGGDNWSDPEYVKATQTVYHSAEYPSRLLLPVNPAGAEDVF
ncbi:MAG: CocE/NonD family hydrolase [Victivallales bacterium]|nr:CocE/NonD family hydrolase [Victivallales bacterium]